MRGQANSSCLQSHIVSTRAVDLDVSFWSTANYCGFLRRTYEPGTMRTTSIFANAAYAEYAGLSAEELVAW